MEGAYVWLLVSRDYESKNSLPVKLSYSQGIKKGNVIRQWTKSITKMKSNTPDIKNCTDLWPPVLQQSLTLTKVVLEVDVKTFHPLFFEFLRS